MNGIDLTQTLNIAVDAAKTAGLLLKQNLTSQKIADSVSQYDIKLELDTRCQDLIHKHLHTRFPDIDFLGEEGERADFKNQYRWVVDPIDGTVNFAYGIPHACVSIALQESIQSNTGENTFHTVVGVVYDPFCDELWTGIRGGEGRLNGTPIRVSDRDSLDETVISIGFAKLDPTLRKLLPKLDAIVPKVRKVRIMGSAALDLVYVATGRLDAYWECGVRLWDIAAGGLILECAGGEFWNKQLSGDLKYLIIASNGRIRDQLQQLI
ncbi:MAG: inositol monophosphatase [Verrucomicrobia bacterium]|nr:inositol monophosphatase [Verrucomicrobiota bacterium]MCF7707535.1 inositol monophosphatase [Verrucomicrobiota bacterium]